MIIIVGCNKGGSGKTTTATNISVGLSMRGHEVCLVDADRQRSAARWHKDREAENHSPAITLVEKLDNTSQTLKSLSSKFDHVIVDVAGRNSREMITAATIADMIIAPHQASQLDLDTLVELQQQVIRVRDLNPELKVYIYHAMASTNPSVKEAERSDFIQYVAEFKEFSPLQSIGYYRKAYKDVIPEGRSVLETDNLQASKEITSLIDEILNEKSVSNTNEDQANTEKPVANEVL